MTTVERVTTAPSQPRVGEARQAAGRPLSVLYFSNAMVRGGAEEHMLTLLNGLDRRHFTLHLVCTPAVAESLRPDLPADVELLALQLRKPRHVREAATLARVLRDRGVDVLHSHLFYSSLFASPIGRVCRGPVIVETPHVREQWRRGWKSHFVVDRLVGRCVDRYIAVSEANARHLTTEKRLPRGKVVVIRNGCDLTRFQAPSMRREALRQELGFGATGFVAVTLGRLEPQKGHQFLLEAWSAVRRACPTARVVCVGEGSLRGALEAEARRLGLGEAVWFVGYQPNVPDWLALADITILPSLYERLPLVAIESLAAGRTVVATAVDGTPEVVVHGRTGLTVPPGDAAALARAVGRLTSDVELRGRLAEAGRRWVAERFVQERQIRDTGALHLSGWRAMRNRRGGVGAFPGEPVGADTVGAA